jgi:heme exporter protein C
LAYSFIFLSSVGGLIFRNPLADVSAKVAAPIGAAFTLQALVTGSIWGKPTWGTYWAWDARLTSFLILFLLYLGLIALWNSIEDQAKAGRAAAILAIVGSVNIPIIHYSVEWWNTLHQGASVFRADGPKISAVFLWPLLIMALAYSVLFCTLHLTSMRTEIRRRRVAGMRARRAEEASAPADAAIAGRTS